MNAGAKFAAGAVLIVGAVGYLMASGVKQTGQFFLTPSELSQRVPLRSGPQSRMTVLGNLALWVAFLVGIWGALTGFMGGLLGRADLQQSARHAVFAMCAALLTAVFALEWALFHHDFNVEYVAAYTSRNLPIFYTWSALYAGQKGSLLFLA